MVKTLPSNAGGVGSIPGWRSKIPQDSRPKNQNMKQKQYCNKFNKDFKTGSHQKKKGKFRQNCFFCALPLTYFSVTQERWAPFH